MIKVGVTANRNNQITLPNVFMRFLLVMAAMEILYCPARRWRVARVVKA